MILACITPMLRIPMPPQNTLLKEDSRYESVHISQSGTFLLFVGIFILFIVGALFGGLKALNARQEQAAADIKEQIIQKENDIRPELLEEIFAMDRRLRNLQGILSNHRISSNILRMVEQNTLPRVQFLSFVSAQEGARLDMNGRTTDFTTLAQQINIFERDPRIQEVSFGGLGFSEGSIQFKLSLILKPSLLEFAAEPR